MPPILFEARWAGPKRTAGRNIFINRCCFQVRVRVRPRLHFLVLPDVFQILGMLSLGQGEQIKVRDDVLPSRRLSEYSEISGVGMHDVRRIRRPRENRYMQRGGQGPRCRRGLHDLKEPSNWMQQARGGQGRGFECLTRRFQADETIFSRLLTGYDQW